MSERSVHLDIENVNGLWMHLVEQGEGAPVVLCHGFPQFWFSWRHQIPALAEAGFRVIAPDQRGIGRTSAPQPVEDYAQQHLCADLAALLDKLGLDDAIFIGHDWGGAVVWNLALHYPERVRAVAGINHPFPGQPRLPLLDAVADRPGMWDYQFYLQEPGVAEAELEADVEKTMRLLLRSSDPADEFDILRDFDSVRERGGVLVGYPDDAPLSTMLTEEDFAFIVATYQRSGFRGGLNWYRNSRSSWEWGRGTEGKQVRCPALMVTAGKDPVLRPSLSAGMEALVPNLTRGHIEECGHWAPEERPEELNAILLDWLSTLPS